MTGLLVVPMVVGGSVGVAMGMAVALLTRSVWWSVAATVGWTTAVVLILSGGAT